MSFRAAALELLFLADKIFIHRLFCEYVYMEENPMKKINLNAALMHRIATALSSVLCAVLFVCANTNSCTMIHQPEAPADLERFSKVK